MSWLRKGNKASPGKQLTRPMSPPRGRRDTDPETRMEVFKSHWQQTWAIVTKTNTVSPVPKRVGASDEITAVTHYVDQMMLLLVEELPDNDGQGPILQYLLAEDILEKLFTWCSRTGEYMERLRLQHLKLYDMLISQARQQLLVHKPVIRPLLKLLSACAEHTNPMIEKHMILLLHQLCVCLTQNTQLLELFFNASADQGPAKFLMFSLLIPYVHRDGMIGQQARDALLLIMALSFRNESIGKYIAELSDFCPVLATGLSGLYSSLPRKLDLPSDDWYQLTQHDCDNLPDLAMFLNSLEFCNAVVQVAHPLVRDQLLTYIYNGFLVPVIGPALHQSSMEEVIAATAYLELFIRRITEPALMRTFLTFILTERHDEINILESLITRISSSSRLCMVSLSLFKTLVDLNCEDIMFQLVLKYLIPCTHVMVSQRRSVKDLDLYSKTAEKFLSLKPACCMPDVTDTPPDGVCTPQTPDSPSSNSSSPTPADHTLASRTAHSQKPRRFSFFGKRKESDVQPILNNGSISGDQRSSSPGGSIPSRSPSMGGTKLEHFETDYTEYLLAARATIQHCAVACHKCWTAPYDGENPSPDSLFLANVEKVNNDDNAIASNEADESDSQLQESMPHLVNGHVTSHLSGQSESVSEKNAASGVKTETLWSGGTCVQSDPNKLGQLLNQPPGGSSAESVASEGDSALSSSSANTDTNIANESSASRSDTPLNDNFESQDFNTFLLSLKRVKTPVEFSDNIEDSLNEIDSLLNELKSIDHRKQKSSTKASVIMNQDEDLPKFVDKAVTQADVQKTATEKAGSQSESISWAEDTKASSVMPRDQLKDGSDMKADLPMEEKKAKIDGELSGNQTAEAVPKRHTSFVEKSGVQLSAVVAKPGRQQAHSMGPSYMPNKYSLGTPNIGPFLSVLFTKLESMMQNSLYVNLLLTGIISRLACYPQPLLRSFLLNHSLVFQPTVKSLIQVLGGVKHKVDCFSYTVKDFESLLLRARRYLAWREDVYLCSIDKTRQRNDSLLSLQGNSRPAPSSVPEPHKEKKRSSLGDLIFRRSPVQNKGRGANQNPNRLQKLGDGKGYRYINRQASPEGLNDAMESLKTKNAIYCALVLEEFLKELAAISQEHAVLIQEGAPTGVMEH